MKFREWDNKQQIKEAMGFVQKLPYQEKNKAIKRPPVKTVRGKTLTMSVDSKPDFQLAVKNFMKGAQEKVDQAYKEYPFTRKLGISPGGKRYLRVYAYDKENPKSKSAYCFIDKTNGDVLKAAGWKSPAKHRRSNIYDGSWGVNGVGGYGAAYMK